MGRRNKVAGDLLQRNKKGTPLYSKEDIKEQYCITSKQLDVLEKARGTGGLFGCLSTYHDSSCRTRNASFLSVCVRRKVPSDENLHELCRRPPASYAPIPRLPRYPPPPPELYHYGDDFDCTYFRRRPKAYCNSFDPKGYMWMPEDEECTRMERRPIRPDIEDGCDYDLAMMNRHPCMVPHHHPSPHHHLHHHYLSYSSEYLAGPPHSAPCPAHPDLPPPPPPPTLPPHDQAGPHPPRTKHVSFARSHTLTSFDDAVVGLGGRVVLARSQERLIDGKKASSGDAGGAGGERRLQGASESSKLFMEKLKRAPMKTQATQTEVCLGRKPHAPHYLSLSPRTIHRVRMVSQGAQTNGNDRNNSRRLMKSYSEAGGNFGVGTGHGVHYDDHEPLHRTQSEEPPRSPFLVTTPPEPFPPAYVPTSPTSEVPSSSSEMLKSTSGASEQPVTKPKSGKTKYKEILINFEPVERRGKKRILQKTLSEGEILLDRRRVTSDMNDAKLTSSSQEGLSNDNYQYYEVEEVDEEEEAEEEEEEEFLEPLEKRPADMHSAIPTDLDETGSGTIMEEQLDDEFHENLVYHSFFRKRSVSLEDGMSSTTSDADIGIYQHEKSADKDEGFEEGKFKSSGLSSEGEIEDVKQLDNALHKDYVMKAQDVPSHSEEDEKKEDAEGTDKETGTRSSSAALTQRSPSFASCDSLVSDIKDQSDEIWNESQITVLPADSENGVDLNTLAANSALGAAVLSLTPTSRRKQLLLLQHQQRSSIDIEALEDEASQVPQVSSSPRATPMDVTKYPRPTLSVTTPSQDEPMEIEDAVVPSSGKPSLSHDRAERIGGRTVRDVIMSRHEFKRRRSPGRQRTPETQSGESSRSFPDSAESSTDLLLARTDSGRTGTDISETSTEDYVTANDYNSGTDTSSRRSNLPKDKKELVGHPSGESIGSIGAGDGSSFESASSLYSFAREQLSEEIAQGPCSPPIIEENSSDLQTTSQVESEDNQTSTTPRPSVDMTAAVAAAAAAKKRGSERERMSPSAESSSSSGSYSVEGSSNDLDKLSPSAATSPSHVPDVKDDSKTVVSDDDHSGRYSSSGYYESPVDEEEDADERERTSGTEHKEWTDEEKCRKKKGFKLDFSPIVDKEDSTSPLSSGKGSQKKIPSDSWSRRSSAKSDHSAKSEHSTKEDSKTGSLKKEKTSATTPVSESRLTPESEGQRRRKKSRSRSPSGHHRRVPPALPSSVQGTIKKAHRDKNGKEPITPGMVRSPAMHEGFRSEDWGNLQRTTPTHTPEEIPASIAANNIGTSDESSCSHSHPGSEGSLQQQISPRRHRRTRDSPRKKQAGGSGGRSPTQNRLRRRSGSGEERSSSSAAALARRRASIPAKSPGGQSLLGGDMDDSSPAKGSRLSPNRYARSPGGSPSHRHKSRGSPKMGVDMLKQGALSPETSRPKALSAESLRSVSPGSDSVFYSEGADHSNNTLHEGILCQHCGREVDKSTLSGLEDVDQGMDDGKDSSEHQDIVQPPEGFADSPDGPRTKPSSTRLYKKLEKRFRSEERSHGERRHHSRYRCEGTRAKSEERGKEKEDKVKFRQHARSTGASMELLRAGDSTSPNMDEDDEDEESVYIEPYKNSVWIYICDTEEIHVWQKPETKSEGDAKSIEDDSANRRGSAESTGSEKDFRRKYQAITHRMVHRKSSVEMYKRLALNSFADTSCGAHNTLQKSLENVLQQLLMVWSKQIIAIKLIAPEKCECDKTVVVKRVSGEFGFRIHGSRPVVVSAIEPDTPAETSGLEVGDIVISINGVNVLEASHSDVVKIAHAGSDTLELEVARTCNVLTPMVHEPGAGCPLYSGYLWKLSGVSGVGTNNKKWIQRWFCLKRDNCLYYYKDDTERQPLGALMLINYSIERTSNSGRQFSFHVGKNGAAGLHLAADSEESATRWLAVIAHSIERNKQMDEWLDISKRNLKLAASAVQQPDCFGFLMKLGVKLKTWRRRYCVLKDACLYFYQDSTADSALGMACLHGYRVQNSTAGGKRFAFEILPSEPRQRHFYFYTETEMDKKRWIAALEYSIDRWIRVG